MLAQVVQDETGILFRCMRHCIQRDFRLSWGLVGVVNPRKIFNFSTAGLGIHALRVPCLTYLQWGIHEHLDKVLCTYQVPYVITRSSIRTDRGADGYPTVLDDLRSDKTNPPDIGIAVLFTKS